MEESFYSRTTFPVDKLILNRPTGTYSAIHKPKGGSCLWASGNIGDGDEVYTVWDEYIDTRQPDFWGKYSYLFEIVPNWSNILSFETVDDYVNFYIKNPHFFIPCPELSVGRIAPFQIAFDKLSSQYAGLYIFEEELYAEELEGELVESEDEEINLINFAEWSVESLVVWDATGIKNIKMYVENR